MFVATVLGPSRHAIRLLPSAGVQILCSIGIAFVNVIVRISFRKALFCQTGNRMRITLTVVALLLATLILLSPIELR